jgi:PhnB protein
MTKPIPEGYHALTPSLAVDNAAQAIEFYKRAFGAKERMRMTGPGDMIGHAELEIGDSVLMLADPMPQSTVKPPKALGGRFGVVADPFGHQWQIATHKEDLSPEEIMERGKTAMAGMS